MSLLLRFQGVFGVDSYSPDTIIMVPQDVAEKSGRFEEDYASDLTDYELAEADHLDELYKEARLAELELDEEAPWVENQLAEAKWSDPDGYELAEAAYLAELAEKVRLDALAEEAYWADGANYPLNYPLNWELYEEARLAKLYDARVAALAEEDQLVEMQLADWEAPTNSELYEDDHLADMHEEVRLDALDEEAHVVDSALHEASRMTEWKEEIRLANWCKEGYPLRWD